MRRTDTKNPAYRKLINSSKWQKLRNAYISRYPLCQRCLSAGITKQATCVHHIKPIEMAINDQEMASLAFSIHNLQSLCDECHTQVHIELRSHSKEVLKARQKAATESFIEKYLES